MDQTPPPRQNRFVLAAVILFNLLWLTLLFLSCQTDKESTPTPTPEVGIETRTNWTLTADLYWEPASQVDAQTWRLDDPASEADSPLADLPLKYWRYKVPLYKPPSTCSITPVI